MAILRVERAEPEDDYERGGHESGESRERATDAVEACPYADRNVDDVRTGQQLAQAEEIGELLCAQPPALFDQHPPRKRHYAAEPGQRNLREPQEQLAGRRSPGR